MNFAAPHLLWLLILPLALLVIEVRRRRSDAALVHPKIRRAEAGISTVSLVPDDRPRGRTRRRILLCAGIALSVVALARPRWGKLDEPVFDQSRDIIIALDLSRSMLTPDVKPSRLERSKLLIESLLDHLKGERVGLIVFSGTAFLQSPVSADYEILREFLPALGPDYLPEGGTNYRQLIDVSLDAFGTAASADRYLIILSDGEATDDDWRERVPELKAKGIKVIGLGVGTRGGAMIPDGSGAFMKDENGAVVLSKLEPKTLEELASATGGTYRDASEWVDLSKVLSQTVELGRKGRFVERNSVRYVERYQWALAQAFVCFLCSFWLEFPVTPKAREIRLAGAPRNAASKKAGVAAALAVLLLLVPSALAATDPEPNPAASLSKIVGRLAAQAHCSALDWSEMARETVTWGQHLKSANQPVPERPVRDALQAVDSGSAEDPKATDWAQLRADLQDLLRKPEDQKQKQDSQQNKDQDKKDSDDSKQDGKPKSDSGGQDSKQQKQQQSPQQQQGQAPTPTPKDESQGKQQPSNQQPQDSAFGKMQPTPTPTPQYSQQPMQKVGGQRKDEPKDPARNDPSLAVPLEKLEQLKNQDSPAELFQMLRRGEPTPTPAATGKNW